MTMPSIIQKVSVDFTYPVHFTQGVFDPTNPLLATTLGADAEGGEIALLAACDANLLKANPTLRRKIEDYFEAVCPQVRFARPIVELPGGEAAKNDAGLIEHLHQRIHDEAICRHSYVLAIGGGAVIDAVGFAAATAHRGIRLIRIPTTVLAQNDASIGVKNGVNAFEKKNFLGAFVPPRAVINDFTLLTTLSDRDWRAGIAEAIKVALIKDAEFFEELVKSMPSLIGRDLEAMQRMIHRCAQLHLEHIATGGDPFEFGSSRPLDYGHWSAHKLEQLTDYRLRHGEAVAIGLALDALYATAIGMLDQRECDRTLELIAEAGFALYVPEMSAYLEDSDHARCVLRGMQEFREHLGGKLTVLMLHKIGAAREVNAIDHDVMRACIRRLHDREEARVAELRTEIAEVAHG